MLPLSAATASAANTRRARESIVGIHAATIAAPAPIPFPNRVAGVGIVEPSSETILLGTQVGGIVAQVMVKEGDRVTKGQPLIEIDARDADARLAAARAKVETAKSRIAAEIGRAHV